MRFICPDGEAQYLPYLEGARPLLEASSHELIWHDQPPKDDGEWLRRVDDGDGLLLLWKLPKGILSRSRRIRVISFAGTGVAEYVDLSEAERCGVTVCAVPDYGRNAVAEQTFALMFAVARQVAALDRAVRAGSWEQNTEGLELSGRRLGVVGAGPIAARVIEIGCALGMSVLAWTRRPSESRAAELRTAFVSLERLFAESDIITLNVAHTPETEHLITRGLIERLPPGAILINTARGALLDIDAVAERLQAGLLAGIGLDVFVPEPPPSNHPLLQDERVVWSPHVGFRTREATGKLISGAINNLVAFADGRPVNVVGRRRQMAV